MAVRIVVDHPRGGGVRFGRGLAVLFGAIFVLAGLIAAVLPLLLIVAAVGTLVSGESLDLSDDDGLLQVVLATAIAITGLFVGLKLIRGRRRMVLFLRRFGHGEATAVVTAAVETAVGNAWRVVTLDDKFVAPVGVTAFGRRAPRLGLMVGLAGVGGFAWWWASGGVDRLFDSFVEDTTSQVEGLAEGIFAVIAAAVLAVFVLVFIIAVATFAGGVTFLSYVTSRAGRRGEREKRAEINGSRDISPVTGRIARSTRRTLGPRLVVVRVATPVWQDVVRQLAGRADLVIVDVSHPTENLVWEIETLRARAAPGWILIAHRPSFAALTDRPMVPGSPAARLLAGIDGSDVIAYDTDRDAMRRFIRALSGSLAHARDGALS
jgi:hypothetical protein